jgi:hypothetical protein
MIMIKQLTLFQSGWHIIPTTVTIAPLPSRIFRPNYDPGAHVKFHENKNAPSKKFFAPFCAGT